METRAIKGVGKFMNKIITDDSSLQEEKRTKYEYQIKAIVIERQIEDIEACRKLIGH